jgi:hypothetical protein
MVHSKRTYNSVKENNILVTTKDTLQGHGTGQHKYHSGQIMPVQYAYELTTAAWVRRQT